MRQLIFIYSDENLFNTPVEKLSTSSSEQTPENRILKNVQNTSDVCSQVTAVRKIIAEARKNNLLGTPQESLPFPKPWDHVDTPDTPLGAFIRPNPSPNLRKQMVRFINSLPEYKPRRDSTPLSELKRRLWDKICPPKNGANDNKPEQPDFDVDDEVFNNQQENSEKLRTPTKSTNPNHPDNIVNNQLQQLQDMLTSSGGNRTNAKSRRQSIIPVVSSEVKDSQPNTIGWDDCMECDDAEKHQKDVPVFMFSGIEPENRDILTAQLESLGAVVTNLSNYDPLCTHLICPKPMRNKKILACIASGKWILHTSYVEKCSEEGKLIDEEPYEYGNPKSKNNIHMQGNKDNEARVLAMHYWQKEIARRSYGPFHDMRAIIVAQKKEPIVRILQAGGGMVIEARYLETNEEWETYKRSRNEYISTFRSEKIKYHEDKIDNCMGDPKRMWNTIKKVINKDASKKEITELYFNGIKETDQMVIATNLNNYYITSITDIVQSIPKSNLSLNSVNINITECSSVKSFSELSLNKLRTYFQRLKCKGSADLLINAKIIKKTFDAIGYQLLNLINTSLKSGQFPKKLKCSLIVPVPKVTNSKQATDMRPVNMLPDIEKIFERAVYDQILEYIKLIEYWLNNSQGLEMVIPQKLLYRVC